MTVMGESAFAGAVTESLHLDPQSRLNWEWRGLSKTLKPTPQVTHLLTPPKQVHSLGTRHRTILIRPRIARKVICGAELGSLGENGVKQPGRKALILGVVSTGPALHGSLR